MKKLFFSATLCLSCFMGYSNQVEIHNLTDCTIDISLPYYGIVSVPPIYMTGGLPVPTGIQSYDMFGAKILWPGGGGYWGDFSVDITNPTGK